MLVTRTALQVYVANMRSLFISLALLFAFIACGDGATKQPGVDLPLEVDAAIDAPPATPSCTAYCTKLMANCTGTNAQYSMLTDCMNSCSRFAVGTAGMTTTNTVGCRLYHAELAQTAPATHCVHAGPGGGDQCGSVCEGYCKIAVAVCSPQVGDQTKCMSDCATYASAGMPYNSKIQSGNTAECRLYHATAAATAPNPHCMHVGNASTTCQ